MNDVTSKKALLEMQKLKTPMNNGGSSQFGAFSAVSPDGSALAIASDNVNNGVPGVFTYIKQDDVWKHEATIVPGDALARTDLGKALSFSQDGTILAIGCGADSSAMPFGGSVYMYQKIGGVWKKRAKLQADVPGKMAFFGQTIKLSRDGNTLVVASPWGTGVQSNTGAVFVFERTRDGDWVQTGKLQTEDGKADDNFGASVDLSADSAVIAVGAPLVKQLDGSYGEVFVFKKIDGLWHQQPRIFETGKGASRDFGIKVSLSGNGSRIAICANSSSEVNGFEALIYDQVGVVMMRKKVIVSTNGLKGTTGIPLAVISEDGRTLIFNNSLGDVVVRDIETNVDDAVLSSNQPFKMKSLAASADLSVVVKTSAEFDSENDVSGAAYIFE